MKRPSHSPSKRAAEKQKSRLEDERALASGEKSAEQLRRENGLFTGLRVRVRLDSIKSVL